MKPLLVILSERVNEPLNTYDLDSICKDQAIGDSYMSELEEESFKPFYGTRIKALRHKSKENPSSYNIVIFSDWFSEFKEMVKVKRLKKEGL